MKIYFKTEYLFFTILAFLFFPLGGLLGVSNVLRNLRIVGLLIIFPFLVVLNVKRLNIRALYSFFLYAAYLTIITLVKQGDIIQLGSVILNDIGVFLLVLYVVSRKKYNDMVVAFAAVFDFELIANLVHMLTTDIGFGLTRANNKIFILSSDNGLMFYLIIFAVIHELRNEIKPYGHIRDILFYGVFFIELVIGESATSLLAFVVLIICVLIYRLISLNKYICLSGAFILFLNFFLIFIRKLQFMKDIFQMLGKDMTLSGRDRIWDSALILIAQSPIFGRGVVDNMWYITWAPMGNVLLEAHNMLLSCMLQGGFILLILYLFMIIQSCYKIKNATTPQASCLTMGLICYWVEFLVECPGSCPGFFMILALCQFGGMIHEK